jgi:hypothetical protein
VQVSDESNNKCKMKRCDPNFQPHPGSQRRETQQQKARRIIAEELQSAGLVEEELARMRKGDEVKVRIAQRLRAETLVTLRWIAERLHMGVWTHVAHLLYQNKLQK